MENININSGTNLPAGKPKPYYKLCLMLMALILAVTACKKEYPAYPYSTVTDFTIKDATGATLEASIANDTITVYWPPFQAVPDSIAPQITVSDRAIVSPASGTKVPFNTKTTYTVKAQNGSTTIYHLKPVVNQAPVSFTIGNGASGVTLFADGGLYNSLQLIAQFFIPDTTKMSFFLIPSADTTKNYRLKIVDGSLTQFSVNLIIPVTVPAGNYVVKAVSSYTSFSNNESVTVSIAPLPAFKPVTLKLGQTFTVSGTGLSQITQVISFDENGDEIDFTVVSATDKQLTLQVPAGDPTGTLYGSIYLVVGGNSIQFPLNQLSGPITITN